MEEQKKEEPKALGMIESAHVAAISLKAENERMEKNIKELREIEAIKKLGGQTEGHQEPEKPKEMDPKEYAEKALKGQL